MFHIFRAAIILSSLSISIRARVVINSSISRLASMLRQCRPPRILITDKLVSYGAAKKEITPGIKHRQHKGSTIEQRTRISRRDGENDK
jgi:putative transposase